MPYSGGGGGDGGGGDDDDDDDGGDDYCLHCHHDIAKTLNTRSGLAEPQHCEHYFKERELRPGETDKT